MDRVILFRAKSTKTKQWVYGYYSVGSETDYHRITPIEKVSDSKMVGGVVLGWHIDYGTLGQFTGLKDKNEKEIYEGDYISGGKLNEKCIVEFDTNCGRWVARSDKYQVLGHKFKMFEIIGNIHDKKE